MAQSSYDELIKQVETLKIENRSLRQELAENSRHVSNMEDEACKIKDAFPYLNNNLPPFNTLRDNPLTSENKNALDNVNSITNAISNNFLDANFNDERNYIYRGNKTHLLLQQLLNDRANLTSEAAAEENVKLLYKNQLDHITEELENFHSLDDNHEAARNFLQKEQLEIRNQLYKRFGTDNDMVRRHESRMRNMKMIDQEILKLASREKRNENVDNDSTGSSAAQTSHQVTDNLNDCEQDESRNELTASFNGQSMQDLKMTTSGTQTANNSMNTSSRNSSCYHGTWPIDKVLCHSGPSNFGHYDSLNEYFNPDSSGLTRMTNSIVSSTSRRTCSQQLGTKMEMVYSLLSMLGARDKEDMSKTLLAMSASPDSCIAMRQSGCLPLLIQLLHGGDKGSVVGNERGSLEARKRASQAMHNIVHAHPDDKRGRREARVLRLLEIIRDYCNELRKIKEKSNEDENKINLQITDKHLGPSMAALMKLSFDEEHRHAMCQLGGLQAIAELIQVDYEVYEDTGNMQNVTLRRYAGMALTNLTFGDGTNKALLCSMKPFMLSLVAQLHSSNEDLRQVTASVLRNLSWRADIGSKKMLREVGAVKTLMKAAMEAEKESTLKSILSALWNLTAHCSMNKVDLCSVDGALAFLVSTLVYKSPSKTLAVVENGGGILRNLSSHIAVHEEYREILRQHNCLQTLLQHLKSPSLTVATNSCGTLWNLSSRSIIDQTALIEMGAINMLRNLVHSKYKKISMGSSAALKNLLSSKAATLSSNNDSLNRSNVPSLQYRKKKALEAELDANLAETWEGCESPKSPSTKSESEQRFNFNVNMNSTPRRLLDRQMENGKMCHSVGPMSHISSVNNRIPRSCSRDGISNFFRLDHCKNRNHSLELISKSSKLLANDHKRRQSPSPARQGMNGYQSLERPHMKPNDVTVIPKYFKHNSSGPNSHTDAKSSVSGDELVDYSSKYQEVSTPSESIVQNNFDHADEHASMYSRVPNQQTNCMNSDESFNHFDHPEASLNKKASLKDRYAVEHGYSADRHSASLQNASYNQKLCKNELTNDELSHMMNKTSDQKIILDEDDIGVDNVKNTKADFEDEEKHVNSALVTPLMFSRCSPVDSLSSCDQYSIIDDRVSDVTEFSGIPTPGDGFSNSVSRRMTPSPSRDERCKPNVLHESYDNNDSPYKSYKTPADVSDDKMISYKVEGTPLYASNYSSLSCLVFDDDDKNNFYSKDSCKKPSSQNRKSFYDDDTTSFNKNADENDKYNVHNFMYVNKDACFNNFKKHCENTNDDEVVCYEVEDTPLHRSNNSSLSCLTFDDKNDIYDQTCNAKQQQATHSKNSFFEDGVTCYGFEGTPTQLSNSASLRNLSAKYDINQSKLPEYPAQQNNHSHSSIFNDNTKKFEIEGTPAQLSSAASLSNLVSEVNKENDHECRLGMGNDPIMHSIFQDHVTSFQYEGSPAHLSNVTSFSNLISAINDEETNESHGKRQSQISITNHELSEEENQDDLLDEVMNSAMPSSSRKSYSRDTKKSGCDNSAKKIVEENAILSNSENHCSPPPIMQNTSLNSDLITEKDIGSNDHLIIMVDENQRLSSFSSINSDSSESLDTEPTPSEQVLLNECITSGLPKRKKKKELSKKSKIPVQIKSACGEMKGCEEEPSYTESTRSHSDLLENVRPPSNMGSVDNLSMMTSWTSEVINDIKPPSIMDELSTISEVEKLKTNKPINHFKSSSIMNRMKVETKENHSNSEILENMKPPSILQDVSEFTGQTDSKSFEDSAASDTEVEEDLPHDDEESTVDSKTTDTSHETDSQRCNTALGVEERSGTALSGELDEDQTKSTKLALQETNDNGKIDEDGVQVLKDPCSETENLSEIGHFLEADANIVVCSLNEITDGLLLDEPSSHHDLKETMIEDESISLVSMDSDSDAYKNSSSSQSQNIAVWKGPKIVKPGVNISAKVEPEQPKGIRGRRKNLYSSPRPFAVNTVRSSNLSGIVRNNTSPLKQEKKSEVKRPIRNFNHQNVTKTKEGQRRKDTVAPAASKLIKEATFTKDFNAVDKPKQNNAKKVNGQGFGNGAAKKSVQSSLNRNVERRSSESLISRSSKVSPRLPMKRSFSNASVPKKSAALKQSPCAQGIKNQKHSSSLGFIRVSSVSKNANLNSRSPNEVSRTNGVGYLRKKEVKSVISSAWKKVKSEDATAKKNKESNSNSKLTRSSTYEKIPEVTGGLCTPNTSQKSTSKVTKPKAATPKQQKNWPNHSYDLPSILDAPKLKRAPKPTNNFNTHNPIYQEEIQCNGHANARSSSSSSDDEDCTDSRAADIKSATNSPHENTFNIEPNSNMKQNLPKRFCLITNV